MKVVCLESGFNLLKNNDFVLCVFVSFSLPSTIFYVIVILKYLLIENILVVKNSLIFSAASGTMSCIDFGERLPGFESSLAQDKP